MPVHERLGKLFAAFELCAFFRGPYNRYMLQCGIVGEVIIYALFERVFGAYHNHVYMIFPDKGTYGVKVVGCHIDIVAPLCGSCVTRSNKEFL